MLSPGSLTFNFQSGGTMPAAQNVNVGSSNTSALAYNTAASAAWVSATPGSGNTPGALRVSVNPQGMAAGTYHSNITVTAGSASNSPQQVAITLNVTGTPTSGSGRLTADPRYLSFSYQAGTAGTLDKTIQVGSTGSNLYYTVSTHGGTWFTVNSSGGTTPGTLDVTVNTAGLARGSYRGVIQLSASGSRGINIPVILIVTSTSGGGGGDGGGGDDGRGGDDSRSTMVAQPYTYDPAKSATVAAQWIDGAGVNTSDAADPTKQGLLLAKNSTASTKAQAGVQILNVQGKTLTQLGFDIRSGATCTGTNPVFLVVTTDSVVHEVGGCGKGTVQAAPAAGWQRVTFNPSSASQAKPAIAPGTQVKSIYLVVDEGPDAGSGMVVLDNININGTRIGSE
jgi:hypothetical protein